MIRQKHLTEDEVLAYVAERYAEPADEPGTSSGASLAPLEQHLAQCDICRRRVQAAKQARTALWNALDTPDWDIEAFTKQVMGKIAAEKPPLGRQRSAFTSRLPRWAVAAAVVAFVSLTSAWYVARENYQSDLSRQARSLAESHYIVRADDIGFAIALEGR